jgi:predicted nucleic-acid-binding protein
MIGLDTNVLARYYVEDKQDAEAARQHEAARRLIESGRPLMVCKTVILEFEWVLRGYYGFAQGEVSGVLRHLLALPHVTIEDRVTVEQALSHCDAGIDMADALHHASYRNCASMASFDDRRFARRAKKMGLAPAVIVPAIKTSGER